VGVEAYRSRDDKACHVNNDQWPTKGLRKLSRAMGIDMTMNDQVIGEFDIWIGQGDQIADHKMIATTRVGVGYAGNDALLHWRYYIKDNAWVSKK